MDWIGKWYTLNKEAGGSDLITFGFGRTRSEEIEWVKISHAEMDGYGAMMNMFEQRRLVPTFNAPARREYIPWYKRLGLLFQALENMKAVPVRWIHQGRKVPSNGQPNSLDHVSMVEWSKEETVLIHRFFASKKYGLNAYLIDLLNRLVFEKLTKGPVHGKILFPVNMRPALGINDDRSNYTSGVYLTLAKSDRASSIHRQFKEKLTQKIHHGNWWLGNIGRIVGVAGMRYLSKRSRNSSFYLGTYTNLGRWDFTSEDSRLENEMTLRFAAPGSNNYPVCMGVIELNGRLQVSLKIRETISPDQSSQKVFLEQLQKTLNADVLGKF